MVKDWEEEDHQKISTLAYYVDEIIDMKNLIIFRDLAGYTIITR